MMDLLELLQPWLLITLIMMGALVVYHHLLYPLILRWISRAVVTEPLSVPVRHYMPQPFDMSLPTIAVVVPAYNEARYIAEKLRNLATLDYPHNKLKIYLFDDGSTDDTLTIARNTLQEPELAGMDIEICAMVINGGKVALLNRAIATVDSEVLVLTDTSALLSHDSLLRIAAHLQQGDVGVVAAMYSIFSPGSIGEEAYWQYQTRIKKTESDMGSVIGVHGAMYAIRKSLMKPVPTDTINDDFIIPMNVIAEGYRCVYDPEMIAVELETSNLKMDAQRRARIAMGNVQQVVRLLHLCHPRHGAVAFNFVSGKVLRTLMPLILMAALLSTVLLSVVMPLLNVLLAIELASFGVYLWQEKFPSASVSRPVAFIHYFYAGHLAATVGLWRYCFVRQRGPWQRAVN